jgi:hypothetical protein
MIEERDKLASEGRVGLMTVNITASHAALTLPPFPTRTMRCLSECRSIGQCCVRSGGVYVTGLLTQNKCKLSERMSQ